VKAQRAFPNEAGQPVPRLRLELDPAVAGVSADDVIGQLWDEDPRIAVLKGEGESIYLTPDTLSNDTEKEIVIAGVLRALRASREGPDVIST
jgi:hypothetical protein